MFNTYPEKQSRNYNYNHQFLCIKSQSIQIPHCKFMHGKIPIFLTPKIFLHILLFYMWYHARYIPKKKKKTQLNFNMIIRTNPTIYKLN